jgi:hypothetical protein
MLGGGPHVALRHRATLAALEAIVVERLPNVIKGKLFDEILQSIGVAPTR